MAPSFLFMNASLALRESRNNTTIVRVGFEPVSINCIVFAIYINLTIKCCVSIGIQATACETWMDQIVYWWTKLITKIKLGKLSILRILKITQTHSFTLISTWGHMWMCHTSNSFIRWSQRRWKLPSWPWPCELLAKSLFQHLLLCSYQKKNTNTPPLVNWKLQIKSTNSNIKRTEEVDIKTTKGPNPMTFSLELTTWNTVCSRTCRAKILLQKTNTTSVLRMAYILCILRDVVLRHSPRCPCCHVTKGFKSLAPADGTLCAHISRPLCPGPWPCPSLSYMQPAGPCLFQFHLVRASHLQAA